VQFGLLVSVLLHVAILGWALFTIQTQRELRVPDAEPLAIDLVSPSDVTKLRQGSRTAKQMEAVAKEGPPPEVIRKEAPKPTPTVAKPKEEPKTEPPPEVKEQPKPEPKVEPKTEPPKEVAKVDPKPAETVKDPIAEKLTTDNPDPALEQAKLEEKLREEQKKADEQKKVDEQKKAEEQKKLDEHKKEEARKHAEKLKKIEDEKKRKAAELKKKLDDEKRKEADAKKKFDAENISALLNKVPDKGAPLTSLPSEVPTKNKEPVLGAREGRDQQLSASEASRLVGMLVQRIEECYRPPVGAAAGLEGLKVRLSFDLRRDGTLTGPPRATGVDGAAVSRLAAEAAERAVLDCAPYAMLPPDKYEFWKGVDLTFNPKHLFGQ
jgi:colicin import membrane protein